MQPSTPKDRAGSISPSLQADANDAAVLGVDMPTSAAASSKQDLEASIEDEKPSEVSKAFAEPTDADFPDGGYGWVIVACCWLTAGVTWGINSGFGVFYSFYIANDYFPGATDLDFAFIGGLSLSLAMAVGPISNFISKRYGFRYTMGSGAVMLAGGQILAGFATKIWHLYLTQGVLFGFGLGFVMVSTTPIVAQWFGKRRALALGLANSGSGAGGLLFSNLTRVMIEKTSLRYAFLLNGCTSAAVLIPCIILIRSRSKPLKVRFEPLKVGLFKNPGFLSLVWWGVFIQLAYATCIYSVPAFATQGLGLTQAQGSTLQSLLSTGQLVGRPLCGLLLDKIGRLNGASVVSVMAGFSCLFVWMFARCFGVLTLFALLIGGTSGIYWGSSAVAVTEVIGIRDLASGLSMMWLAIVVPATISEPISVWFIEYSRGHLHRTGASAFVIGIGFAGAMFIVSGLGLLGAKFYKQGNRRILQKV